MSLITSYQLLENISKSTVTDSSKDVDQYYFKGWSQSIGTSYETLGTETFDEIHLPSADQALQLSSSDSSDTSKTILIIGFDSSFAKIQEIINTDAADGQTPVTLSTSFFRIKSML